MLVIIVNLLELADYDNDDDNVCYDCQPVGAGRGGQGVDGVGRVAPIVDPLDQLLLARANLTVGSKYKVKISENK